jgi:hypothetical protein
MNAVSLFVAINNSFFFGIGFFRVSPLKFPDVIGEAAGAQQKQKLDQTYNE